MMMADNPDPARGTGAESARIDAAEDTEMLRELAQIGMRLVRLVEANAQARAGQDPAADLGRVDQAFAKLSRSIRLTLALKAKLADSAAKRAAAIEGEERTKQADESRTRWQKVKLKHAVADTLEALDAEHLLADLHERLEDPDIAVDLGTRPLGEMVASVCDDLGVPLNRNAWRGKGWYLTENWRAREGAATPAPSVPAAPARSYDTVLAEALAMMEETTNPGGFPPPPSIADDG